MSCFWCYCYKYVITKWCGIILRVMFVNFKHVLTWIFKFTARQNKCKLHKPNPSVTPVWKEEQCQEFLPRFPQTTTDPPTQRENTYHTLTNCLKWKVWEKLNQRNYWKKTMLPSCGVVKNNRNGSTLKFLSKYNLIRRCKDTLQLPKNNPHKRLVVPSETALKC